jgi:integrase
LSRPCLWLLEGLSRDGEYLFPAPTREGFMDPPQKAVVFVRETSGIADFRLHDIRRTVRTRLPGLGVSPDTAERVLGHALQGMRRVYDQHDYLPETRPALEAWGEELDRIHQSKAHAQSAKSRVTERPSAMGVRTAAQVVG